MYHHAQLRTSLGFIFVITECAFYKILNDRNIVTSAVAREEFWAQHEQPGCVI
jgi:hypothetical protein